jgi:hypothetical protein
LQATPWEGVAARPCGAHPRSQLRQAWSWRAPWQYQRPLGTEEAVAAVAGRRRRCRQQCPAASARAPPHYPHHTPLHCEFCNVGFISKHDGR